MYTSSQVSFYTDLTKVGEGNVCQIGFLLSQFWTVDIVVVSNYLNAMRLKTKLIGKLLYTN